MKKILLSVLLNLLATAVFAAEPANDFSSYFKGTDGCFILYDVNESKIVQEYNPARCAEQITPGSTFKIPLSLMAFDQELITQQTVFKWDGRDRDMVEWNKDQTPHSWLQYSVVWVSQYLTPQLGIKKINHYLKVFHYGNEDFSGDPGKNNGLERAWLGSSLKISADQQVRFLTLLISNKLPVSQNAMISTKNNMYIETTPNGWRLYGKTGSAISVQKNKPTMQTRWFVGYIQKADKNYVFIVNFTGQNPKITPAISPARTIAEEILAQLGVF